MAGPKRPQDRVALKDISSSFKADLTKGLGVPANEGRGFGQGRGQELRAHPRRRGDRKRSRPAPIPPTLPCWSPPAWSRERRTRRAAAEALGEDLTGAWVAVVTEYLDKSGLTADLDAIGFNTVGYGCTTCIGNSGPLDDAIVDAIEDNRLVGTAVISGNRNFEGRVHANVRANYLASRRWWSRIRCWAR